jgi:hypothetical protein
MALPEDIVRQVHALVEANRARCLWFLREDYLPEDTESIARVLVYIERRGDLPTYIKARKIREWLSRNSSTTSAD